MKFGSLIADDHALILEGLTATIGRQEDMAVVAKAADGREAIELWEEPRPDVVLLDLRMPKLNGVGVMVTRDGSLWIGFASGGGCPTPRWAREQLFARSSAPGGGVLSMAQDSDGAIWAGGQYS